MTEANPFRPVKRESYEQQLDMSAPPPMAKLVDETDELVDVGLSSSQQTAGEAQPRFLETSQSSLLGASGGTLGPKVASGAIGPAPTANAGGNAAGSPQPQSGLFSRLCAWFSVEYYQPYFDVNTATVLERIKGGVSPHKGDLFASTSDVASDLYGAIWISFTLIFLIGATSNLNSYFAHSSTKEPWERDYTLLTGASSMVLIYTFVIPALIWAASLYVGVDPRPSIVKLVGVYGYSMVVFIPASVLCVIPSAAVQWIVVLLAGGLSGVVIVRNLYTAFGVNYSALSQVDTEAQEGLSGGSPSPRTRTSFLLISGAAVIHAVFSLLLKLFFFQGADLAATIDPSQDGDKGS